MMTPVGMSGATAIGSVLAAIVLLLPAATASAGGREPVPTDPAAAEPFTFPQPTALARGDQLRTVSTGSTAGFDADPALVDPGDEETIPPGAGATGWWDVRGRGGSEYVIDSCGSSYPVRMTAYDVEPRMRLVDVYGFTPDACAEPLTGTFYDSLVDNGPDVIRIDDASGAGGDYVVNYSRTPIPADARINSVRIRQLKRIKGHRRIWRAKVAVRIRARAEAPIEYGVTLDDRRAKSGTEPIVFRRVRSGRHTLRLEVSNRYSGSDSDKRNFGVPFRKP